VNLRVDTRGRLARIGRIWVFRKKLIDSPQIPVAGNRAENRQQHSW